MGILTGKKKGAEAPDLSDETKVGPLKDEKDELDTTNIKVPSFPGTEKRVTVVATTDTKYHKKGEEFSIPEANLEKMEAQGYKLKK